MVDFCSGQLVGFCSGVDSLAAEQGIAEAAKARDIVTGQMTPDQIAKAQRLVREWKPKSEHEPK